MAELRRPETLFQDTATSSQLTTSDKLSRAYALQERLEDFSYETAETKGELADLIIHMAAELNEVAQEVRELGEEYQEACDNIRDNIPESPTADECEEKAQELEGWADELEQAATTIEGHDPGDIEEPDEDADADEDAQEHYENAVQERFNEIEGEFTGVQNCPI